MSLKPGTAGHGVTRNWLVKAWIGNETHGLVFLTIKVEEFMKKIHAKLIGKRPILFCAFRIETITALTRSKTGSAGNDPEEWKRTVLEKNGVLYIPGSYWSSCLKEGAKYTKAGRGSIQKMFRSCAIVLDEVSYLDRKLPDQWEKMSWEQFPKNNDAPVYLDIRGVLNPNSKAKNVRYRVACSPGWKTEFSFAFDDNIISLPQAKKVLEDSGKLAGVGDGRVLGYGRFDIEDMQISDYKD